MNRNVPPDGRRGDSGEFDLASIFLGPKAENAETFERLLLDAFRDHVFWRRNHHPEDGFLVEESEKYERGYERSTSILRQELLGLLAELKGGVPFFSQRYIAHMASDLTMASLLGYFATMLYNPNNVSVEASPVTTRMELEVADQLARMIGYDPARQWGHLTSGGTIANYEALWVARNVKYLPAAIHWAVREVGIDLSVDLPGGSVESVAGLDLWRLLNITPTASLDLLDRFGEALPEPERAIQLLDRHSLGGLGYQEFGRRLSAEFGDALAPAVVLVPSTAHYSWAKICRSLGIGGSSLRFIPVDRAFRMDLDALDATLRELAERRQPVIACVSVVGTTEESAVDRLDRIAEVREAAARELGIAFHLHADAAYGGYAAAITRRRDGGRLPAPPASADDFASEWPSREVYEALCALERTDSATIDPHKLGFVPYPAGAVSFRDRRARNLVAVDAPYVFHRDEAEWGYIGRYILEGSKPGAAAAGVWMSHKVLPLDVDGYGRLIRATAGAARLLHDRLGAHDWAPFRIVRLPAPDINLVCFAFRHPGVTTLEETNALTERVHQAMSVGTRSRETPDYYVSTSVLRPSEYGPAALPIVEALGFEEKDYLRAGGVSVIRCTVMDPFLAGVRGPADHIAGLIGTLAAVLAEHLGPADG